jgi:pyrroline-5-carboxylate reductase
MRGMEGPETLRIAFIGGGHMARALIGGLLRRDTPPAHISVGEPLPEQRTRLEQELGVRAHADNLQAARGADVLVLAVKPQEAAAAVTALARGLRGPPPLLLSIVAGLRSTDLARWAGHERIVRAMPNRPALLGAGISGAYAPTSTSAAERRAAESVLTPAGRVVWLSDESQLDLVTALSGSGPAYFFLLAEQLAAAAVQRGLDADTAQLLAAETLYGAGQLAHQGLPLAQQRAAVTSKGGTTAAALQVLAQAGLEGIVARAFDAAAARGAELALELGESR